MARVGVLGAGGRMGRQVCAAVARDPELVLVGAVDPAAAGADLAELTAGDAEGSVADHIDALDDHDVDVVVDFTVADQAAANLEWCVARGVHAVVGTTGIDAAALDRLGPRFAARGLGCVVAANFAVGAVLMMRFAELAAAHMDGVEIVELHHDAKLDAPSGTALATAERLEGARRAAGADPWPGDRTATEVVAGSRGAAGPGGIRIHSVRLPGLVAHQEVVFGALGQSLSIRHDAYDRSSFMPGVLLAVKHVAERPGLTVGLDPLLGL